MSSSPDPGDTAVAGVDFFRPGGLPVPQVTIQEAERIAASFGLTVRYRDAGYFFSSTGGSPVSSVAGLAVLDVIRDEGLQANAARVGSHLKARLEELAVRHSLIGAVHGSGLCVLKIKPPLCLDVAGADFFADALDRVLAEGW